MLPDEQELNDLKLDIGLLTKDVELTNRLCEKLSESIEKLQEVNVNILRMITLHEQRHDQHEKSENEMKDDIKELHSRITTVTRELHERIDQVEHHITSRIDDLRSDLLNHKKEDKKTILTELSEVEKWKWLILGVVMSSGFILGKLELSSILSFIK
jgi:DNA repair exonuclease SbcCD ATPase subunit